MARRSCDGAGLLASFRAAVANLEAHVDEVNGLNVYPVPDGATGSNMAATLRAALAEAEGRTASVDRVAAAISFGALMGARGNSGVITSQIVRGMAEGLASKRRFNGLDLAHALTVGTRTAYAAVGKPVEGTILTVIREASVAAVEAAERENDLEYVLRATVEAAEGAVARTPSLLPILREAGVVDAGGQGLLRMMQGSLAYRSDARPWWKPAAGARRSRPPPARRRSFRMPTRASGTRRCSSSSRTRAMPSTSMRSRSTCSRSAIRCSSRAIRGPSRSTCTASGPTR
jgi:dihydroxyacetone kinase-like predicted kinase